MIYQLIQLDFKAEIVYKAYTNFDSENLAWHVLNYLKCMAKWINKKVLPPPTHSLLQRIGPLAKQVEETDLRDCVGDAPAVEHEPVAEADGDVVGAVEQVGEEGQEEQGHHAGENLWRVLSLSCHDRGNLERVSSWR